MSDKSGRMGLPFILPGQAQKEVWHNEALTLIDASLHPTIEGPPIAVPPVSPTVGQCWIVGEGAAGEWADRGSSLACWTDGGWRFVAPMPGMTAWDRAAGLWRHWDGSSWSSGELPAAGLVIGGQQVVGGRQPAIVSPSGGTIIDVEARAAVDALIAALMSHGLID